MRGKWLFLVLAVFGAFVFWHHEPPMMDVHAELQQRLLEAELGSATTFHIAGNPKSLAPSDETVDSLLTKLQSVLPDIRWDAAGQLARRRDPRAVDALIRAMHDPSGTVRICVMASALGKLKDPRALSALTEAAFDPVNRDLRLCAIQSLGMIKDPSVVPKLIEALEIHNTPVAAADAIARMGDERGVAPIIRAAADPVLRLWMISALGELGSPTAGAFLKQAEHDAKKSIRNAAVEAQWKITQLSSSDSLGALMETLRNEPAPTRRMWAAFRLGEQGKVQAIPALLDALGDPEREVRGRAAAALVRFGRPALPPIRTFIAGATGTSRSYAVAMLGYLGGPPDIPGLQNIAQASDTELARTARTSVQLIQRFTGDGWNEGGLVGI
ncbi:MAG: HEAT repeat domain-containing protein [Gammaproteobacteria bacterium]